MNNETNTKPCPECGQHHSSESVDLWTLCEACFTPLVTDAEVLELGEL